MEGQTNQKKQGDRPMQKLNKEIYKLAVRIVIANTEEEINKEIDRAEKIIGKINHGKKVDLFDVAVDYMLGYTSEETACDEIYEILLNLHKAHSKVARPVFDKELAGLEAVCAASLVAITIEIVNYFN